MLPVCIFFNHEAPEGHEGSKCLQLVYGQQMKCYRFLGMEVCPCRASEHLLAIVIEFRIGRLQ